ncbi:unnamed protein product [Chironomus riparius]|uniref:RAP domain-containing protein n=1 Tax=Chironomus riparius TaxID=315576 RepID=A0A9N9RI14_9DIPT|nr:unnamed protein product [Chironomus riparius]
MMLRIVSKSLLLHRACSLISHKVRHNHLSRISSVLGKMSHFPSDLRSISNINEDEDIDQENFYHMYQLANKYLSHDISSKDRLMKKIDNFNEIQQVVKCIENKLEQFNKDHIIQLLLLTGKLRDKQELTIIKNLDKFVEKIGTKINEMNDIELGITLLHLRLLGFNSRHPVMQKVINSLMDSMSQKKNEFDSLAMSLFTEAMCLERDLYSKLIMVETLPVINSKLNYCNDALEFYHLISCLNNVHPVLSSDSLNNYKDKIEEFLDKNLITNDHVRIIFKTINFLNFPHWSTANAKLIQKFLILLEKSVPNMQPKDLFQTNRALFVQYEPSMLIPLLRDRAKKLLEETQDVELLQIACLYCTPQERIKFVEMLRDKVLKYQTTLGPGSDSLASFFKILRLLKISDTELCDCFWTKIVNKIFSLPEPELRHRLPKYFHRYMNFNNNLGGTYRHIEFEKIVYEYCVEEMKTGSTYIPKEFSKFASFVIAYSDRYECIPPFVIEKLIMMQEQLNIIDCKLVSRGLEILHGFRPRRRLNRDLLDNQMEILQYVLDSCAQRHLETGNLSIKDINVILSSYVRRRAPRDSSLFFEIMGWYDNKKLELNSRTIREICHSLQVAKFCNDSVCDQFFNYVVDNKDIVTGETVEKILTTCYNLSYFPENPEALDTCSDIIHRDFNVMSGLSVVQALLALTFYKSARAELISLVFNGDFIKRLEQEVQMAYSRDTYPQKVMSLVMQLNRAVCLDHPEYNIRWFQQSFIEAQMSKKPVIKNKFHEEVHRLLLHIVPSRDYLAVNQITPYGYRIDFEIHIDKNYNKFLKPNPDDYIGINYKPKVHKVAILLLSFDTFCINDINRLRGTELLRMRHLEMMNYKVIHVKKSDLKMLYENVTAKIKHLKKLLQIG